MPKQSYELTTFNEGMVSHPDPEDLTINAATYTNNLDSIAPAGTLGSKKDYKQVLKGSDPFTSVSIFLDQKVGVAHDAAEYTMVYFVPALGVDGVKTQDARIGFIEDFYGMLEEQ